MDRARARGVPWLPRASWPITSSGADNRFVRKSREGEVIVAALGAKDSQPSPVGQARRKGPGYERAVAPWAPGVKVARSKVKNEVLGSSLDELDDLALVLPVWPSGCTILRTRTRVPATAARSQEGARTDGPRNLARLPG